MKKITALLTALGLSVLLAACSIPGGGPEDSAAETVENTESAQIAETADTLAETTEAQGNIIGLNLSDAEVKQVKKVALQGDFDPSSTYIENLYNVHVLHTGVVGLFGCPVEITSSDFSEATIYFEFNPDDMNDVPEHNLIVLHYNEIDSFYDTIPSTVDSTNNRVSADINEPGVYLLADAYEWYSVWGMDVSGYESHDTLYKNTEYCFQMMIPEEIHTQPVGDYLKDDEEGKCKTLLECKYNDQIQVGIEYLERPYYASAQEFVMAMAKIVESNGALKSTGVVSTDSGAKGFYFYADFGPTDAGQSLSINCVFPLSDTQYINIWYGFTDESHYETVMRSLTSFAFTGEADLETVEKTEEEVSAVAVTTDDLSVSFPEGMQATAVNQNWQESGDMVIAPLYELEYADFSPLLYDSLFEVVYDPDVVVPIMGDNMENAYSAVDGFAFLERHSLSLSNGGAGEVIIISNDTATETYPDAGGVYYFYGFYETGNPEQYIAVFFALDKTASAEEYQALADLLTGMDVK